MPARYILDMVELPAWRPQAPQGTHSGGTLRPQLPLLALAVALGLLLSGCYEATRNDKRKTLGNITNTNEVAGYLFCRSALLVTGGTVNHLEITTRGEVIHDLTYSLAPITPGSHRTIGVGMACALAPGDLYITAAHCVAGSPINLLRVNPDLSTHILLATVVWRDDTRDVAILRAPGDDTAPVFDLAPDTPARGDPLVALGNLWELSAGTVEPPWDEDAPGQLRNTIPNRPGDSGGPVVGSHCQLYGVAISRTWRIPWFWIESSLAARVTSADVTAAAAAR